MSTELLVQKMNKEVEELKDNIKEIKKFLFNPFTDSEGEYQEAFIKKMILRNQNRGTFYRFVDRNSFLKHVSWKKRTSLR